MRNKILAIIITIVVMGGLLAAGYFFLAKKPATQTAPQAQGPTLTKISDDEVVSPVVSYDGSKIWYFNSKGHLFRRILATNEVTEYPLSDIPEGFYQAIWPAKGDDFMFFANNKYFYSSGSGELKQLPSNIQNLDFMPDGFRIAYIWKSGDGESQSLYVGNADATGFSKVKDVFWPDMKVKVSPEGTHALLWRSQVQDTNKIYEANLISGEFTTVVDAGKNIDVRWVSPTKFLFVAVANNKYELNLYDFGTGHASDLGVEATIGKTVATPDGKYVYVDMKDGQTDSLYKIDLDTRQSRKIYQFDSTITPSELMLDGPLILFVNSQDKKLYKITQ